MLNSHYKQTKIQPIEVINDWNLNFNLGNIVKYIGRLGKKDDELKELNKIKDYIDYEIERVLQLQK